MRLAGIVVLTFLVALALGACQDRPAEQGGESAPMPDQEMDGFALTQTRDGVKLWVLSAAHALIYEEAGRIEMDRIRVDFFDNEGGVRSTLTAASGLLLKRTNDMEAMGNVVVTASDGTCLRTERLTWNERTGEIESDRFVRVTQGMDEFTGVGLEADPDLKNIKVREDFKAYVRSPEGELIEEE